MTASTDSQAKPAVSQRKREANQRNALLSTGPKTEAGKAISRANALKHGLCARVVDVPGENPELLEARHETWKEELNPDGSDVGDYLVMLAARKSVQLDRCYLVQTAVVAQLARDAKRVHAEARMLQVDDLLRMLQTDPDVASRRLKQTPEGCAALLHEWSMLRVCLESPAPWDVADEHRALRLLGHYTAVKATGPSKLCRPTAAIVDHRMVAEKLKRNECPSKLIWSQKYSDAAEQQYDLDQVDYLADRSALAVVYIEDVMDREVAWLEAKKAELEASARLEFEEADLRARFDASDAGKLIHRYAMDAERGLFRALKEVHGLGKSRSDRAEKKSRQGDPARPGSPASARNEANLSGMWDAFEEALADDFPDFADVPIAIGARRGRTHRRS